MAGDYEKPITIHDAIKRIGTGEFLLPAIQRKFTWDHHQICVLFDSIMRGYPINTFMFWRVEDSGIKTEFRFYRFLDDYCEWFAEDNPEINKVGDDDFFAVVDGQQRLTSMYLGLKGTFAYKLPRKWWPKSRDESVLPTRKLYLNLVVNVGDSDEDDDENEDLMLYDFRFLSDPEIQALEEKHPGHWFRVGEILELPDVQNDDEVLDIVMDVLADRGLTGSKIARQMLTKLYFRTRRDPVIHYFEEKSQDMGHVLDIFIRTNKGGTPLSFSDLLMSIAVANWKDDARKQIDSLVYQIRTASDLGFNVNRDFILKTCLALTDSNVRFKVANFKSETVDVIENMWPDIQEAILATLRLIKSAGINDHSLRAKNAVIPICYYLLHYQSKGEPLYKTINNQAYHQEKRRTIIRWLNMALLKSLFSGTADGVLTKLIGIIRDNIDGENFPLSEIVQAYRGTTRDLSFDDEFVERLLATQKDDAMCFPILSLLMPDVDTTRALQKDHLHPEAEFKKNRLNIREFLIDNDELRAVYENKENWNGIANLHLLDAAMNSSKQDKSLQAWLDLPNIPIGREHLMIPMNVELTFEEFPAFIEGRKKIIKERLTELMVEQIGEQSSTESGIL